MPFRSEAQRSLAHAVASGKSGRLSLDVARKMIAHDPGGKLPKKVKRKSGKR